VDSPWERLQWTLPSAFLLSLLMMGIFLRILAQAPPLPQPPIDARIVELAPPAQEAPGGGSRTAPALPPPPPPPMRERAVQHPKPMPPRPRAPSGSRSEARTRPETSEARPGPPGAAAPAGHAGPGGHLGGGAIAARAIYKPTPVIPEELRRHPFEAVAVARFRIAPDGTAKVELVQPTGDPSLNRTLLETLATWRFFPALVQGRPMASSLDIRIPVSVR
jgi:protein TonB